MNHAASYRSSVPHHPMLFPDGGGHSHLATPLDHGVGAMPYLELHVFYVINRLQKDDLITRKQNVTF